MHELTVLSEATTESSQTSRDPRMPTGADLEAWMGEWGLGWERMGFYPPVLQ